MCIHGIYHTEICNAYVYDEKAYGMAPYKPQPITNPRTDIVITMCTMCVCVCVLGGGGGTFTPSDPIKHQRYSSLAWCIFTKPSADNQISVLTNATRGLS